MKIVLGIKIIALCLLLIPWQIYSQSTGDLLIPRYGLTATTDGTWIYVYGGAHVGAGANEEFTVSGLLAAYERINPNTLESEYYAEGLHRRANHSSVFINGGILSCGGRVQNGLERSRTSSCEFFLPDSLTSRNFPPLTDRLRTLGMTIIGSDLYVVGGLGDGKDGERYSYSSKTYKFDFGANEWKYIADMPIQREGVVVANGDSIFAIGGYNGNTLNTVMVFDTKSMKWKQRKNLPYGISAFAAVTDGDCIYFFGDYKKLTSIHRYNISTGDFFILDLEIKPRRHLAAVVVDRKVIVIGGNQNSLGKAVSYIEAFEFSDLSEGGKKLTVEKD